ncbi:cytoplasmic protein [Ephemerocybe angulata]|uniref:Cytoplasmic protein n=1 Tax=Ephemerocybe angulata TaxID=980116 RepID=A0A8H6HV08_9AGAR|nr:cytoplasmic protein [Tulosesus angulatus]
MSRNERNNAHEGTTVSGYVSWISGGRRRDFQARTQADNFPWDKSFQLRLIGPVLPIATIALALLVCGKTTGKTLTENGDYIDIYQRFLQASLAAVQGDKPSSVTNVEKPNHDPSSQPIWQFSLDPYDVVRKQEYPTKEKIDDYDGIILTGSAASAYENVEWVNKLVAFVKDLVENRSHIKVIGICFGHQIIARAFGGECVPNGGRWEIGPTPLALTDLGQRIFGVESLNIQAMHRDHVPLDRSPPGFDIIAATEVSPNQAMVRFKRSTSQALDSESTAETRQELFGRIHVLTMQGHPEFTEPIVSSIVEARSEAGVIDAEAAEDCVRRRFWRNDGVDVIGRVLWGVLGVQRSEG